jgi:hypothetical protein
MKIKIRNRISKRKIKCMIAAYAFTSSTPIFFPTYAFRSVQASRLGNAVKKILRNAGQSVGLKVGQPSEYRLLLKPLCT